MANRLGRDANRIERQANHSYLECPEGVDQKRWYELVMAFQPDAFSTCDVPLLRMHCQTQADLAHMEHKIEFLELSGEEIIVNKAGNAKLHPFYLERDRLRQRLQRISNQIKSAPSARKQSVQVQRPDMDDAEPGSLRAVV